jgi:hypothetical protein
VQLDKEELHFVIIDLLIAGYSLVELTASQLLCLTILILRAFRCSDLTKG